MTITSLHKRIKKLLPISTFLVVEHSYRNYEEMPEYNEMWCAHAYEAENGNGSDNQLFCLYTNESPAKLIELVKYELHKKEGAE